MSKNQSNYQFSDKFLHLEMEFNAALKTLSLSKKRAPENCENPTVRNTDNGFPTVCRTRKSKSTEGHVNESSDINSRTTGDANNNILQKTQEQDVNSDNEGCDTEVGDNADIAEGLENTGTRIQNSNTTDSIGVMTSRESHSLDEDQNINVEEFEHLKTEKSTFEGKNTQGQKSTIENSTRHFSKPVFNRREETHDVENHQRSSVVLERSPRSPTSPTSATPLSHKTHDINMSGRDRNLWESTNLKPISSSPEIHRGRSYSISLDHRRKSDIAHNRQQRQSSFKHRYVYSHSRNRSPLKVTVTGFTHHQQNHLTSSLRSWTESTPKASPEHSIEEAKSHQSYRRRSNPHLQQSNTINSSSKLLINRPKSPKPTTHLNRPSSPGEGVSKLDRETFRIPSPRIDIKHRGAVSVHNSPREVHVHDEKPSHKTLLVDRDIHRKIGSRSVQTSPRSQTGYTHHQKEYPSTNITHRGTPSFHMDHHTSKSTQNGKGPHHSDSIHQPSTVHSVRSDISFQKQSPLSHNSLRKPTSAPIRRKSHHDTVEISQDEWIKFYNRFQKDRSHYEPSVPCIIITNSDGFSTPQNLDELDSTSPTLDGHESSDSEEATESRSPPIFTPRSNNRRRHSLEDMHESDAHYLAMFMDKRRSSFTEGLALPDWFKSGMNNLEVPSQFEEETVVL